MTEPSHGADDLNEAVLAGWEENAAYYDEQLGEAGDVWARDLIGPVVEQMLDLAPGSRLLEVACGTGVFARRMAARGIDVCATDLSPAMVAAAQAHAMPPGLRYAVADANDAAALSALSAEPFDAAVCNMALMSMPQIAPMYRAVIAAVRPGAPFVLSTLHPAFGTTLPRVGEERIETPSGTRDVATIRLARYKNPFVSKGVAVLGQPLTQFYFHRALEYLLIEAFEAGWSLDALEEPTLPMPEGGRPKLMWETLPEIPPAIVFRLRKPPQSSAS